MRRKPDQGLTVGVGPCPVLDYWQHSVSPGHHTTNIHTYIQAKKNAILFRLQEPFVYALLEIAAADFFLKVKLGHLL